MQMRRREETVKQIYAPSTHRTNMYSITSCTVIKGTSAMETTQHTYTKFRVQDQYNMIIQYALAVSYARFLSEFFLLYLYVSH